jgi:hypothetical protein
MGARTGKDCEGTRYEEPPGKPKSSYRIKRQCLVEKAAFFGDLYNIYSVPKLIPSVRWKR